MALSLISINDTDEPIFSPKATQLLDTQASLEDSVHVLGGINAETATPLPQALRALVMERVRQLHIPDPRGLPIALSTAEAIRRTYDQEPSPDDTDPTYLSDLYQQLLQATDRYKMGALGITLGDRALHVGAGFIGTRHVTMTTDERVSYAGEMARVGYGSARQAFGRDYPGLARSFDPLTRHFAEAARVLGTFRNSQELTDAMTH